jgi:predicted TIM-barrel fold metal-dependent hydrolase
MLDTVQGPIPLIDADSHILEPADLWTSRVPAKYRDAVPRVDLEPKSQHHHWRIGDNWLWPVGHWAQAGWKEYPPLQPQEFDEVDPASFDPVQRLKRLDEFGIDMQILYPNVIGFQAPKIAELSPHLSLLCTQVYNDFLLEWASTDIRRLIPIAMLPYWDRDAAVAEMERCVGLGHRGVLFANKFERIGLPSFNDPYWDAIYSAAQDLDIPVNYHIGFTTPAFAEKTNAETLAARRDAAGTSRPERALSAASVLMSQCDVLGSLLTSGLCERFPRLKLVSVESGFGQIPFYLEALDWHWRAFGDASSGLLPSEYFERQCFGTFWFERNTLALLERYPDNFMFSTDFPHLTCLAPGPVSPAMSPDRHVSEAFADIDPIISAKVLSTTARNLYKI